MRTASEIKAGNKQIVENLNSLIDRAQKLRERIYERKAMIIKAEGKTK